MRRPTSSSTRGKVGRILLASALAISLILGAAWALIATAGRQDRFAFLHGHHPILSGVFPIIEDGYRSKGFTDEYRVYSWREDFSSVCTRADDELAQRGYIHKVDRRYPTFTTWRRKDGFAVMIEAMHSLTRKDAFAGKAPTDFTWVTVVCQDPIPDTWISHARYAIEPTNW